MNNILVLGAGFGGLTAANELLNHNLNAEITVIDKKQEFYMGLTKLWVMAGRNEPKAYMHNLDLLSNKGINFVKDEITRIDLQNKLVKTIKKNFSFDYLVVSLGADLDAGSIPGFREHACNLYEMEGAGKVYDKINKLNEGRVALLICKPPYKCPAAPYETMFLLNDFFTQKGIRDNINLEIYTPEQMPMPLAGPNVAARIVVMLDNKRIEHYFNHKVTYIDARDGTVHFENGKEDSFDVLIGIPPHVAPKVVKDAGLTDDSGWIPVNKKTLMAKFHNVFAIGDNAAVKLSNGMMLPKAGIFAEEQAKVVAHNIANEIKNNKENIEFNGKGYCFVELGSRLASFVEGNFFAEPNPAVELKGPSEEFFKEKENFEKERIMKWFYD